jgi:hypothetical protein
MIIKGIYLISCNNDAKITSYQLNTLYSPQRWSTLAIPKTFANVHVYKIKGITLYAHVLHRIDVRTIFIFY